MLNEHLIFHHLGLAVSDPSRAVNFLRGMGYVCQPALHDPLQQVMLMMCHAPSPSPAIEVIYPTDQPGPLTKLLVNNQQMIYHVGYSTPNLQDALSVIKDQGHSLLCVSPPKPAVLFNNAKVSFYIVVGFGLIEIIER